MRSLQVVQNKIPGKSRLCETVEFQGYAYGEEIEDNDNV